MSSIHKMRTSICNTLGLQKVVCPYKGLLSEEKMTGTLYPKENGCDNRVVVLTRSSCEGVPLYYVIPVRHVRQDIFSVEDFGVLKSCFSYFIHFCYKLKIYDFIRPFYSCMLETLVLECTESRIWVPLFTEPSVSLMCIWTLFTFEKKWSCTSAQGRGTQHPTVKLPLRVFTKKGYTFCSTGLRFLQKTLYMSVECRSK